MSNEKKKILIAGLKKAELNGRCGFNLGVDEATGRCMIQLERGKPPIKLKPENVVAVDDWDALVEMATANGSLTEARVDEITDEIAQGKRSEAEAHAHLLSIASQLHFGPGISALTAAQQELIRYKDSGEYVICNVVSRPELNGMVCYVSSGTFGQWVTPVNTVRLLRSGETVLLHNDKLVPLAKAPAALLYDEEDLALDEHPISADSVLLSRLKIPNPQFDVSFAVRVHGLDSAAGQPLNGRLGTAFRDRGDGRLAVRFTGGVPQQVGEAREEKAVRIANLMLAREVIALGPGCAARAEPNAYNAASRQAGNFVHSAEPQRSFFLHMPPRLPRHALEYDGAGWPGLYTDRRFLGLSDASPAHVVEVGSWRAACERWEQYREGEQHAHCPYVLLLSTPLDEQTSADELAACMRWMLAATRLGHELANTEGLGVIGAHVEPPSVLTSDLSAAPQSTGHVALSLCSMDTRHGVYDVLNNLVDKPRFSLTIRGRPIILRLYDFDETPPPDLGDSDDESAQPTQPAQPEPARKRRQDDWVELKACDDGLFRYESWELHRHPSDDGGLAKMPRGMPVL